MRYTGLGIYRDPVTTEFASVMTLGRDAEIFVCAQAGERYAIALGPCHTNPLLGWVGIDNITPVEPPLPAERVTPLPTVSATPTMTPPAEEAEPTIPEEQTGG